MYISGTSYMSKSCSHPDVHQQRSQPPLFPVSQTSCPLCQRRSQIPTSQALLTDSSLANPPRSPPCPAYKMLNFRQAQIDATSSQSAGTKAPEPRKGLQMGKKKKKSEKSANALSCPPMIILTTRSIDSGN